MAFVVRRHLSLEWIVVLNVLLGLMVIGFGVVSLLSGLRHQPVDAERPRRAWTTN